MSGITSHVLDTSAGRPAAGIEITLSRRTDDGWEEIATQTTDDDGRVPDFFSASPAPPVPPAAVYRLRFATGAYFAARNIETFYPHADIVFTVTDPGQPYHVPLLLNPWGYSTYRGS